MLTGNLHLAVAALLVVLPSMKCLTGHTETAWNVTTEESLECVEWNVLCDVTHQHLTCCRREVIPVVRYQQVTTCAEGWLEDSNGSCSTAACSHCPSNTFCLSNGTCAKFCEVHHANTSDCVCSPGVSTTPICTLDTIYLRRKLTEIVILEKRNQANNRTVSKIRIQKDNPWSNQNGFNYISVTIPNLRLPKTITSLHRISNYGSNSATISFTKRYTGSSSDSISNARMDCIGNQSSSQDVCTFSNFDRYIDHGDSLILKPTIFLEDSHTTSSSLLRQNRTYSIHGQIDIGFDFQLPEHCKPTTCSDDPLQVSPEISKGPITINWNGWRDSLSGIKHYILQIYKMEPDTTGYLRQPPDAIFSNTTQTTRMSYLPSDPGVYAILITVEDRASNRNYARRFVLYDNVSRIEFDKTNHLYFASATKASSYHWQSNATFMVANWRNHFVNSIHEKGHFLSRIDSSPIIIDNTSIVPAYDDEEGKIKLTATPNSRGIIRFDYIGPLSTAPDDPPPETEPWIPLDVSHDSLDTKFPARGDGTSMKVWVKAYDVMGHTAVDSAYVFFDSSPPTTDSNVAVLQKNYNKFSSRVSMEATDRESGIFQVHWDVVDKVTGQILTSGFTSGNKTDQKSKCRANIKECTCVSDGTCYLFRHYLYIDHCPIKLDRDALQRAHLSLHVKVVNYALLTQNFTIEIGKATTLNGIKQYSPPLATRTPVLTTDSVVLAWDYATNCYRRTGLDVAIRKQGQEISRHTLTWNSTEMEMIGLEPDTDYTATFVVQYGNVSSDSLEYAFSTDSVKVDSKYIVVIVIETLVVLLIFVALVVTLKKLRSNSHTKEMLLPSYRSEESMELRNGSEGYRKTATLPLRNSKTAQAMNKEDPKAKERNGKYASGMYEESTICHQDEDVYEDLDGNVVREPIDDVTNVITQDMISVGEQFSVYVGTCNLPSSRETACAIKAPTIGVHEEDFEEFERNADALLTFHKSHGIHAVNILRYFGSVTLGNETPALVIEYCDNRSLGEWLVTEGSQSRVDDLEGIVYGVACGMRYLVTRKIFHGSLTSFHVLLDSQLTAKIKGFENRTHKKKSVRWQAPERLDENNSKPNEAADVWSYGTVMWEAFSQGMIPYEDIADTEVKSAIKNGTKLKRPAICPDAFNAMIVTCMQHNPASRPAFADIVDAFKGPFDNSAQTETEETEGSNSTPDIEELEDSGFQPEIEEPGIYENTETSNVIT
ncbi:uncharacterized protein [Argopecten irradians]|uniref:uncharacterized protein n=1 Tax=Argopecten irradians TaxID=31199 RepID=UPI0037182D92